MTFIPPSLDEIVAWEGDPESLRQAKYAYLVRLRAGEKRLDMTSKRWRRLSFQERDIQLAARVQHSAEEFERQHGHPIRPGIDSGRVKGLYWGGDSSSKRSQADVFGGGVVDSEGAITVVLGDVTSQVVDVVVNSGNPRLTVSGGVDGAIRLRGGPAIGQECAAKFPEGLPVGDAGWTTAGNLPARWVIHTICPPYRGNSGDRGLLASCYRRVLEVADELEARSVAFPLIGAGVVNRWPQQDAIAVATDALVTAETKVEEIRLVTLERVAFDEIRARSGHRPQREAG